MATSSKNLSIIFLEHFQLCTHIGLQPKDIRFNTVTMESDQFICIRENGGKQLVIVDMTPNHKERFKTIRRPLTCDLAIMHPQKKILALKIQKKILFFNIDLDHEIKSYTMKEEVIFSKWISFTTIGLVTNTAVYHWSMEGADSSVPKKMFERHSTLIGTQVINYRTDAVQNWLLLIAISAGQDKRVLGFMQLHSVEKNVSQTMEGHAGAFAQIKMDDNPLPSNLFCVAYRNLEGGKLHISEIGDFTPPPGNRPFPKKIVDIVFPPEAQGDFPVAMQMSAKYEVIYLVTKYGYIHLYDLESGQLMYMNRISGQTIFVTAPLADTGGLIGVNHEGQVISVTVNETMILSHLVNTVKNKDLALRVAVRHNLSGIEDLFIRKFNNLFQNGLYIEAAKVAAGAPKGFLRTLQTIQRLKNVSLQHQSGEASPLLHYLVFLLNRGQLNSLESLELCRELVPQGKRWRIEQWMMEDKILCTEELGDLVKQEDDTLALSIYLRANVPQKVIASFLEMGQFSKIPQYAKSTAFTTNYVAMFRKFLTENSHNALQLARMLVQGPEPLSDVNQILDILLEEQMGERCAEFLEMVSRDQGTLLTNENSLERTGATFEEPIIPSAPPMDVHASASFETNPFVASGHHPSSSSSSSSSHNLRTDQNRQGAPLAAAAECTICFDGLADSVFIPCGHMCICSTCAITFRQSTLTTAQCPICRTAFTGIFKIFSA